MISVIACVCALIGANASLTGDIRAMSVTGRSVLVRLPKGYDLAENRKRRFPVLYLLDGQNVFDGSTSYIPGQEWRADETAEALEDKGKIEPIILVAIYNAGSERANEYTPVKDEMLKAGGQADIYGKWMIDTLKPEIDHRFRTRTDAASTALGGSSLGGLFALHQALTHSDVWGKAAVISPSVWWANRAILNTVTSSSSRKVRLWVDIGTQESKDDSAVADARLLRDALIQAGWKSEDSLHYVEIPGAQHNEGAWSARFGDVLTYLFPKKK